MACLATLAGLILPGQEPAAGANRTVQERLGHPASARLLVIHADDLGMAHSVNRATFEALEQGWITSASILVPCPWFPEVARWARAHPEADLGIHLALNSEWTGFRWSAVSSRVTCRRSSIPRAISPSSSRPCRRARIPEVERELRAQVDRAKARGIRLSHLDSHMGTLFQIGEPDRGLSRVGPSTVSPSPRTARRSWR